MVNIADWCIQVRRALRGRYVRLLEEQLEQAHGEIARERADVMRQRAEMEVLRLENRALVNSLLGTAGIPPIDIGNADSRQTAIAPVRRRSWPQISATREIEAAREAFARERETRGA